MQGADAVQYYVQQYRVIKKDGLNFVRLYFLNYTRYVNDVHNTLKEELLNFEIPQVETKTKRTPHSSRRLSVNELTNAKILCCIVAILLLTDAAARLCARRAL